MIFRPSGLKKGIPPPLVLLFCNQDNERPSTIATVNGAVKVPLAQNQFDALVSGEGAFKGSTLLKKLNATDYIGAADQFPQWNKGGGKVMKGLVRRRAAERELFLKK